MLLELCITLTGGLLLAISAIIISKIISDKWVMIKFKKIYRDLPMFPEPFFAGNHMVSMIMCNENCELVRKCHEEFGDNIWALVGSKLFISTIDLDLIKKFILDEPNTHLDRMTLNMPLEEFERSIMLAPKEEWRHLRKAVAPGLANNKFRTTNVIEEIEVSISKLIGHIERQLDKEGPGYQFLVDDFAQKYSMDLVFRCFYKQYDQIDFDNPQDLWSKMVDQSLDDLQTSVFVKLSVIFPAFRRIVDWMVWNFTEQGNCRKKVVDFVKSQAKLGLEARKQLKEREAETRKRGGEFDMNNFVLKDGSRFKRNLSDHIIDQFLDGKITKYEYINNASFMMGAADRTTSDCITHTIYLLSIHLDVQDKLRDSIKADGSESEYLDWVLKESLRLMPPAPIGCSRGIEREMKLNDGHIVPAGTFIHTNAYTIHRLKKYWGDDADEFKPDRWRDTSQHHPLQYIPFGAGIRGCPGKMFALFELKMLFVSLLTRYEFRGKPRDDAYRFNSPMFIFMIPYSETRVEIKRI